MNTGKTENTIQSSFNNESEIDFLEEMEKYVISATSFNDLHTEYQVNIEYLRGIIKSTDISLETKISNSQKRVFINHMRIFYQEHFEVKETRIEKHHFKESKLKTKRLRSTSLTKKQKVLSMLQKGFDYNGIGAFEKLRIERIKKLHDEINLLKKIGKNNKRGKTELQYKKPLARIIYTPMGGKVD